MCNLLDKHIAKIQFDLNVTFQTNLASKPLTTQIALIFLAAYVETEKVAFLTQYFIGKWMSHVSSILLYG